MATEDFEAWKARMRNDREPWLRILKDWRYQARMNRDHGHIDEEEYQRAVASLRSEFLALGEDPDGER